MTSLTSLEHRTLMLEVMPPPDGESTFVRLSGRINNKAEQVGGRAVTDVEMLDVSLYLPLLHYLTC